MRCTRLTAIVIVAVFLGFALVGNALAAETKGALKEVLADKQTFVVMDQDRNLHTFQLATDAKVFIDDREAKLTDLKAGDRLTVTWDERDAQRRATLIVCRKE